MTPLAWALGDSWTDPRFLPWAVRYGWPQLLALHLGIGIINSAVGGSGYARTDGGVPFPVQAVRGEGAGASVCVLLGSLNDPHTGYGPDAVYDGAVLTYRLLRNACPDAALIVAGPQWGHEEPPGYLYEARDAVRAAADEAGALFLDALDWFRDRPEEVLPDGIHVNEAGQRRIARLLMPSVRNALPAAPSAPLPAAEPGPVPGWLMPWDVTAAAELPATVLSPPVGSPA